MPTVPQTLHTLGWMYHLVGQNDRARSNLRRALDLMPANVRYRRDLATVAR